MEWKMETILQLIDLYRQYPCLWNSDVDGYKCKKSRNVAWTEISDKLEIERNEIERKMRNLMSQFSRECKRYRRAKIEGKIYRSKWYGFKRLLFLRCKNKEHICRTDVDEIQNNLLTKSERKSPNYYFNDGIKIENYEEQLSSINNHFQDFISFKENNIQENELPIDNGQLETIVNNNNNVSPEVSIHEAEFQQEQTQQQQQQEQSSQPPPQQQQQQIQQQQPQQQQSQQQQEQQEIHQLQQQQQQKYHRHQCQHHQHHRHHHHHHHHQRQRSSGSNQFQDQDSSNHDDDDDEEEDVKPKKAELRKKLKLKCSLLKQMNKTNKIMPSTSTSSSSNRKIINKRIKVKDVYGVAYKALTDNANKDTDRFEHVGKNFALKMKEMNHKQQVIAEKIISDVIFYGEIEHLNVATAQKISNVLASSRKD